MRWVGWVLMASFASSVEPVAPALPGASAAVAVAAENLVQALPDEALPDESSHEPTELQQVRPFFIHRNEIAHGSHVCIRDGCSFMALARS